MTKGGHLRLVCAKCEKKKKNSVFDEILLFFSGLRISKTEKILVLKEHISNMYRDDEITTGEADIPYFVKAENKMGEIIREGKVDFYYNKLRKYPAAGKMPHV